MTTTRRDFLKASSAAGAVLVLGLRPDGALAAGDSAMLNPFVKVGGDGRVTALIKHFEMGQGPTTGLTTLIAEELGVTMDQIDAEFAPSNPQLYNNLLFGPMQGTGGSTAMANSFMQYRTAGAAAREMILAAAARAWNVPQPVLWIEGGMVRADAHAPAPIGDFVAMAAQMTPPEAPRLKTPAEWRLIGNAAVRRKDNPGKINGTAQFAMDMQLPGQMVVAMIRPPRMGATVASFDASGAEGVKGFIRAEALPTGDKIAVYGEQTWAALSARDAITVEWDNSKAEMRSSDDIRAAMIAALDDAPAYQPAGDLAATQAALDGAAQVIEKTFTFPLLAHAPMEPLTCTIAPDADGGVTVHDGAQFPTMAHATVAQILKLQMPQVRINTLYAGGSFGRRANPTVDYQSECAMAFTLTDRSRPVKVVWSREDDITGGYYRPAFAHKVRVGLDGDGNILGWDHRIAGQSIVKGTMLEAMAVVDGVDGTSVEGVSDTHYMIPGFACGLTDTDKATSVLWWRSVGHTHTAYVMESMIDVVAEAAGRDPLEFRLALLDGDHPGQRRLRGVLQLAAEKAGWGKAPAGRTQGLAVHSSFASYVAEVVEISDADGVRVEKVTCAVDCGVPVNPDIIKAQMEGGIGFGLGHAMRDEITLSEGVVDQSNFPDYEPLRMRDIAEIEVHIVASAEPPTGVGEPGVPPSAPALANAIARASGTRVTALPMSGEVDFA